MPTPDSKPTRFNPLLTVLLIIAASRLLTMVFIPFTEPTEPRYAETARMMAESGDWITPWFDYGVPFWGKPPLSFWLQALSFRLLGVSEFSARFPAWIATVGSGMLVYALGGVLANRRTAFWSTLIFATMAVTYVAAGAVMTDAFLVFGTTLSLVGIAMVANGLTAGWRWAFFIGLAIGLLAKGPLAPVLVGGTLVLWLLWSAQARRVIRTLPWFRGIVITGALSIPWYIAAELKTPGFLEYFIVGEHFLRFVDHTWSGDRYGSAHHQPYGTIWWYWLLASFPWGFMVMALTARRLTLRLRGKLGQLLPDWTDSEKLLIAAALLPGLFFTFSGNTLWTYPFPGIPPLALLLALSLSRNRDAALLWAPLNATLLVVVPAILTLAGGFFSIQHDRLDTEKYLVGVYQSARKPGDSRLQFIDDVPFSARYYNQGQVDRLSMPEAVEQLNELTSSASFLALPDDQLPQLLSASKATCEPLTRSKEYTLLRCHNKSG